MEWYEKAANAGHALAMRRLATCYYSYKEKSKNIIAHKWLVKARDLGDYDAVYDYANLYYSNGRCEKNISEEAQVQYYKIAFKWMLNAALAGHEGAMYKLSCMYKSCRGIEKDPKVAAKWLEKAAIAGHGLAMYKLGCMYESGFGKEKDPKLAVEWVEKAAIARHGPAMYKLGCMYESGFGKEKDPKLAIDWMKKAIYAGLKEEMLKQATFKISMLCFKSAKKLKKIISLDGGQEKCFSDACRWLKKAERLGFDDAGLNLGILYYSSSAHYLFHGYTKRGIDKITRFAEKGNKDAMYVLGKIYLSNRGVEKNYEKGLEWLKKSEKPISGELLLALEKKIEKIKK